jgi:hypothetical protein
MKDYAATKRRKLFSALNLLCIFVAIGFATALFWARHRDPFTRIECFPQNGQLKPMEK